MERTLKDTLIACGFTLCLGAGVLFSGTYLAHLDNERIKEEFIRAGHYTVSQDHIDRVFEQYDSNKNGSLDKSELTNLLKNQ